MNKELAKTLTTALVQFIDRERPEGTMCCSSAECESIEQMFEGGCYDIVEEFIKKKLTGLTEFEYKLVSFALQCGGQWDTANEEAKKWSREFIDLAKKELLSYPDESNPAIEAMADLKRTFECNPDKLPLWLKNEIESIRIDAHTKGYNKGYKDAEKRYNESVAYHYDDDLGKKHLEGYILGREDTMREMKDFIDSHFNTNKAKEGEDLTDLYRKEYERNPEPIPAGVAYNPSQCGTNVTIVPNTNSGESTLKAEG